ncbi:MAG: Unknown protein [uncultured Aureispira sp.]|uniref:Uncharacterized protein n=1 Tax=uncultured Aureispira sp. TaxID=1331704 RepID=A0A6S6S626_9BACT|nr:MAG: Unknown protein [uncultured Aureispira sp.]
MQNTTKNKKQHLPFFILTVALFVLIFGYQLLTKGLFGDSIFYSAMAQNLSNGIGTPWHLTNSGHPILGEFYGHPPLAIWLLSYFIDFVQEAFWAERLFSLLNLSLILWGISKIWKLTHSEAPPWSTWWVWLCWLIIPLNIWSFQQYMLENTMTIFVVWSIYFGLLASQQQKYGLGTVLMGLFLFLATFSKGPVGLFPLVFFMLYWLIFRRISFSKGVLFSSLVLSTLLLSYVFLFFGAPESLNYFEQYYQRQLITSLSGGSTESTLNERLSIVEWLFLEPLALWIMAIFSLSLYAFKKEYLPYQSEHKKWSLLFLLLGLAGTLPIMISAKQGRFYMVPALPFIALAIAHLTQPILSQLLQQYGTAQGLKRISYSGYFLLLTGLILLCFRYGKYSRDQVILEDIELLTSKMERREQVLVRTRNTAYSAECYLVRVGGLSTSNSMWEKTAKEERANPTTYILLEKELSNKHFYQYQKDSSLNTQFLDLYTLKPHHQRLKRKYLKEKSKLE